MAPITQTAGHVEPFDIKPEAVPGATPGIGLELARWLPLFLKLLDVFKTGKGYLTTNVPGFGKRYLILSDKLPEGF